MSQNAKIGPLRADGTNLGRCSICGDAIRIDWLADGTARGRVREVRRWMQFVWRHQGCMDAPPLTSDEEAWLRKALPAIGGGA